MSEFNVAETLSAQIFDKACTLINEGIAKGENPLVCLHAVESMLRKQQGHIEDRFITVLMNDLSDMYFWHPERSVAIDKKWHTQGIDLYKPYPYTQFTKTGQDVKHFDREACFSEIEDTIPIQTLLFITIEELAELQQAVTRIIRHGKSEQKYLDNLAEEMADSLICINHLLNLFSNQKEVEKIIDCKLYQSVQRCRKEKHL